MVDEFCEMGAFKFVGFGEGDGVEDLVGEDYGVR